MTTTTTMVVVAVVVLMMMNIKKLAVFVCLFVCFFPYSVKLTLREEMLALL